MAHLTCKTHKRRVLVVAKNHRALAVHRSDGGSCASPKLVRTKREVREDNEVVAVEGKKELTAEAILNGD